MTPMHDITRRLLRASGAMLRHWRGMPVDMRANLEASMQALARPKQSRGWRRHIRRRKAETR